MAVLAGHVRWYEQIFAREGFLAEPVLLFGFQDIGIAPQHFSGRLGGVPEAYRVADLVEFLHRRGLAAVEVVDHFDPRAQHRWDMNLPVPAAAHGSFGTLIDIGSLEHVFDTRQALENCLRLVRLGGHYLLHTCVKGYYLHGLHTFHPEVLGEALRLNGFEIVFRAYSSADGEPLADPAYAEDALLWLVGRKLAELAEFVCPQQGGWEQAYAPPSLSEPPRLLSALRRALFPWVPPALLDVYRRLRGRRRASLVAPPLRR